MLLEALEAYAWNRSYPGSMTQADAKSIEERYLQRARARFGEDFDAFARTLPAPGGLAPRLHRMARSVTMQAIWLLAAFVGLCVLIDWSLLT